MKYKFEEILPSRAELLKQAVATSTNMGGNTLAKPRFNSAGTSINTMTSTTGNKVDPQVNSSQPNTFGVNPSIQGYNTQYRMISQPQLSVPNYLSNSTLRGPMGADIRQRNQRIQGWNQWNAEADRLIQEQAAFNDRWRRANLQTNRHFANNVMQRFAPQGFVPNGYSSRQWAGMSRNQQADVWNALPPTQRREIMETRMKNERLERSRNVLYNSSARDKERQRFANNMIRTSGRAWDAAGRTSKEREDYIEKRWQAELAKRWKEEVADIQKDVETNPPKTTTGASSTGIAGLIPRPKPALPEESSSPVPSTSASTSTESEYEDNDPLKTFVKTNSANIMSILFPQRARDIVKEYF